MEKFEDEEQPSKPGEDFCRTEFDCPACDANNPYGDGFDDGDEVFCFYCGKHFLVRIDKEGRVRLIENL